MTRITTLLCACLGAFPAAAQQDGPQRAAFLAAAQAQIQALIAEGCMGDPGTLTEGVVVQDLDGDGFDDLILSHEGMQCQGGLGRSGFCGAQVCTTKLYLWRGGALVEAEDILGSVIDISATQPPVVTFYLHGDGRLNLRWNGVAFQRF